MNAFIKRLQSFLEKKWFLFGGFVIITLLFNIPFLKEIIQNPVNISHGDDTVLLSYFAEKAYRSIIHFQNPFAFNSSLLYPFGTYTVLGETGMIHGLYFLFLRPFLHPYAALLAVVVLNLFFCQIATYALLRHLKVSRFFSFLFANVFAYAPFVSVRVQYHYNYVYHFLFPLITLLILLILEINHSKIKKIMYSVGLGLAGALLVYNTLYYLFMYLIFISFFIVFYVLFYRKKVWHDRKKILNALPYLVIAFISWCLALSPFLLELFKVLQITELKHTPGWGGAIGFSANALDIIRPSEFNPFIGRFFIRLNPERQPVEQIIYPGILVLVGIYLFIREKKQHLFDPLLWTAVLFFILSLGPFLHFYKYWNIRIEGPMLGVIPLPYVIFHKLPLLSMMRAPVRFAVMISFPLMIIAAQAFDRFFQDYKKRFVLLPIALLLLFFLDQYYIYPMNKSIVHIPSKSYSIIKNDTSRFAVMEIPYTVQDGFFYWGKVFHAYPMLGQLIHEKPVIGGYLARVPDSIFQYYMSDPFLLYYGYVADDIRQSRNETIAKPRYEDMKKSLDFLDIKYVLVREDLKKFKEVDKDLKIVGFQKIVTSDNDFSLYKRIPKDTQTTQINIYDKNSRNLYGDWSYPEKNHRWVDGSVAGFLIKKTNSNLKTLSLEAVAFGKPRKVSVYFDNVLQKEITIETTPKTYSISLQNLHGGLNNVHLKVQKTFGVPRVPGDARNLTIAVSHVVLQ